MGTEPVLDQTAIGTVRGLIGYGCGKEAKAGHPGTQTDAPRPHIPMQSAPRYDPTAVGATAIGSCIQLDCLRANESGSRAFWLYF